MSKEATARRVCSKDITIKPKLRGAEMAEPTCFVEYFLLLGQIQIAASPSAIQFEREPVTAEVAVPACFVEYSLLFFRGDWPILLFGLFCLLLRKFACP
jgi:hypothetical protein